MLSAKTIATATSGGGENALALFMFVCIIAVIIGLGRVLKLHKRGKTLGKVYTNSLFAWLQIMAWGGAFFALFMPWLSVPLVQNANSALAEYGIHDVFNGRYNLFQVVQFTNGENTLLRNLFTMDGMHVYSKSIILCISLFTICLIAQLIQFVASPAYPPKGFIASGIALVCSVLFFAYMDQANNMLSDSTSGLLGSAFMSASVGPYLFLALSFAIPVFAHLNLRYRKVTDSPTPAGNASAISPGVHSTLHDVDHGMGKGFFCWHCGSEAGELKKFCPDCGTPTAKRETQAAPADVTARSNFCSECGTKLFPADRYCPGCGTSFN